ncbi:MAG: hypothetical protein JW855_00485 [Gammaproteobacteria bacterium]|nr:hypothetical protein [Gammaproteobacteria bacterium]
MPGEEETESSTKNVKAKLIKELSKAEPNPYELGKVLNSEEIIPYIRPSEKKDLFSLSEDTFFDDFTENHLKKIQLIIVAVNEYKGRFKIELIGTYAGLIFWTTF